ncbi:DNA-(apurinic or apyrimidinic site) lyase /endonuclease III [Anseongella ginsenosidimutans]|uniref:Endonuclease III n=1 Tax=Anseongella ginsenosidimutans TaxID=496056 RepID=A0A4R3KYX3_9SPHI|nr:endonuclease III [Anseongella ginsenosidimutans]QEC51084.1 endonuclease III [Anseongella ginsenosidimutans]TCS90256.1 DNA-(apurinic or apyrimidinic site) lyase /endonuclease III [Anseongella ginsenosidimutans]
MLKKERYKGFIDFFSTHQPDAETELHYTNPFELLVAVILSAQCTDKRVNMITPALFERFPAAAHLAAAEPEDVFPYIRTISYPNNKAKHLVGMARMLMETFEGKIPSDIDDLQKLPGVGRKTANVIASVVYQMPAMAVDTHVFRVSHRIGLVSDKARTPYAVEKELLRFLPEDKVYIAHHWLILHGRYICIARNPKCLECGITAICNYFAKNRLKEIKRSGNPKGV